MDEVAQKRIIGSYDWIKRFNVTEYLDNAPLIEKLYEEKQMLYVESVQWRQEKEELNSRIHKLDVRNTELKTSIREADRRSTAVFFISLVAAVMAGFGGNFAASEPKNPLGWVLIVLAGVLEIILFLWQRRG